MADLVTSARAKYNIPQSTFTSAENTTIAELVTAYSKAIQVWCRRQFVSASYDQLFSGNSGDVSTDLYLREIPVTAIDRVATGPTTVIQIQNTGWPTTSRATVQVKDATNVILKRTASAATTTSNLAIGTYTTLSALVTAINALGNGWSATIAHSDYNTWATADLRTIQGVLSAINGATAELVIHTNEISDYDLDDEAGILVRPYWPRGWRNIRVQYTAGYATVPEDVQEACSIMVAGSYMQTKRDPMTSLQKTADYFYNATQAYRTPFPDNVRRLLLPYRLLRVVNQL